MNMIYFGPSTNISNSKLYHQQIAMTFTDHSYTPKVNLFNLLTYKRASTATLTTSSTMLNLG